MFYNIISEQQRDVMQDAQNKQSFFVLNIFKMLRSFLTGFDMFGASPNLRMRGESEATNLCAGVASLLILIYFAYIFFNSSVQILNYEQITSVTTEIKQLRENETHDASSLIFAIGLRGIAIREYPQLFNVSVSILTKDGTSTPISLVPCTLDMWSDLGDSAEYYFDVHSLGEKYCADGNQNITLRGLFNAEDTSYLYARINACSDETFACASQSQVKQFFDQWYQTSKVNYVVGNFLFLNTEFNPQSRDPLVHYIQDHLWLTFSPEMGTEALVEAATYQIISDESMFPWILENSLGGVFVKKFYTNSFPVLSQNNMYAQVFLMLGSHHVQIDRVYGKIDDTLSYVGGLFGLVIAFLAFFMMSFNQYRYQIFVGENFNYENQNKFRETDFHFFQYVKYCAYDWIKTFTCFEPDWKECKKIEEVREEALEQLDVQTLLKRMSHVEEILEFFIPYEEDLCTYLTEGQHVDKLKKRRKVMHYYNKIIEGRAPMTISDMNNMQNVFGIQMQEKNNLKESMLQSSSSNSGKNIDLQLDLALKKASKMMENIQYCQLDEQDKEMEGELTEAFYNLQEKNREKLQDKIPLRILKRLKARHEKDKKTLEFSHQKFERLFSRVSKDL